MYSASPISITEPPFPDWPPDRNADRIQRQIEGREPIRIRR